MKNIKYFKIQEIGSNPKLSNVFCFIMLHQYTFLLFSLQKFFIFHIKNFHFPTQIYFNFPFSIQKFSGFRRIKNLKKIQKFPPLATKCLIQRSSSIKTLKKEIFNFWIRIRLSSILKGLIIILHIESINPEGREKH